MRRHSGFSLIELLVVIAIVALLIALLIPGLKQAREVARRVACASQIRQFGLTAVSYDQDFQALPPGNGNFTVIAVTSELRDRYRVPARLMECPSLLDGLNNYLGGVRRPWETAQLGNGGIPEAAYASIGYFWPTGYALTSFLPTGGGWNLGNGFPHYPHGYYPLISMTKPVYRFEGIAETIPELPPGKLLIMQDLAYSSVDPAASATNGSNDAPLWGSHAADDLGNAAGGNNMLADLHVEWQPVVRGKSWRVFGRKSTATPYRNWGFWLPSHAPPPRVINEPHNYILPE